MAVKWNAISEEEVESAIGRLGSELPPRQVNAVRRAVLMIRRGG
jgi:hypothetical protein